MRPNLLREPANIKRIAGRAPRTRARPGGRLSVSPDEAFAALAGVLVRVDGVHETRHLGTRRLAFRGRPFAMAFERTLVVRLPRADLEALVEEGLARWFEPAPARTREWASIRGSEDLWLALAREAMLFATISAGRSRGVSSLGPRR